MRKTGRVIRIAVLALTSLLAGWAAFTFTRFRIVEHQFPSVKLGDSRESVVSRLGDPNFHHGPCGVIHVAAKKCVTEYVYSHPFAPLLPDYYIVSFSAESKVIEADRWTSP